MERRLNEYRKAREVFHPIKLSNERIVAHFQNGDNNSMLLIDCGRKQKIVSVSCTFSFVASTYYETAAHSEK